MRPRVLIRLLPTLAVATALGLAGTGCGSSSSSATGSSTVTLDPLAHAASATAGAGGARMSISARIAGAGLPSGITIGGDGFFNYKSHEGSLQLTLTGIPANAAAGIGSGGLQLQELISSTTIYVGSPLFAGKLPGGAHWIKIDLARAGQAIGFNPQQLLSGQSNPAQLLEYLKASSGGVKKVGTDLVRGVSTTHYRGAIDLAKVADAAPAAQRAKARALLQKLAAQLGGQQLPVDVWIDGKGLVRRISLSLTVPVSGQTVSSQILIELFDFGPTPTITVPAAGDVYDATQAALSGLNSLSPTG
jgi:hypothetical protein